MCVCERESDMESESEKKKKKKREMIPTDPECMAIRLTTLVLGYPEAA